MSKYIIGVGITYDPDVTKVRYFRLNPCFSQVFAQTLGRLVKRGIAKAMQYNKAILRNREQLLPKRKLQSLNPQQLITAVQQHSEHLETPK